MTSMGDTALAAVETEPPVIEAQDEFSDGSEDMETVFDDDSGGTVESDTAEKEPEPETDNKIESTEDIKEPKITEPAKEETFSSGEIESAESDTSVTANTEPAAIFAAGSVENQEYETIKDQTLQSDLVISGNAEFSGSTLNLNGHTLTIEGNLHHTSGKIEIAGGTLEIKGDYQNYDYLYENGSYHGGWGSLVMEKETGQMIVGKDFYMYSYCNTSDNKLKAGTIRIGGNFKENASNENFVGQGSHEVIFTGNGVHEIEIGNSGTCFNILGTEKGSKLSWTGYYNVQGMKNDLDIEVPEGKTVTFPSTEKGINFKGYHVNITGDVVSEGNINLDQGSLTIGGNLHHTSGKIEIAGGTLEIKGDYQNYDYLYENGSYHGGWGSLVMEKETGQMIVGKDFYMYSYCNTSDNKLKAGTIRIGGNFKENASNENFVGQGSHEVIFTGNGVHEIEIGNSGTCFNILETEEGSKLNWTGYYNVQDLRNDLDIEVPEGKTINFYTDTAIDLKGHHVSITGDAVHDNGKLELNGAELTISGDMRSAGDIDLDQGTLSIGGNLHHTLGNIEIAGGTLNIKGDYRNYDYLYEDGNYHGGYGSLVMEKESDCMTVGKDFYMYSYRGQDLNKFQAGTIRIGGNFKENVSNENFVGQGSHKVIFTGNGLHEIEIGNSGTCFNILETEEGSKLNWTGYYNVQDLRNDLDIEVPEGKTINFYTDTAIDLKGHHVSITGDAVHDNGKLELNGAELTISGDMRSAGDIDLDQGTLSIGGNLHHTLGNIEIAGGTLNIKGDYRNYDYLYEDGNYHGGYGSLVMEKESDCMTVGKDFYMYSYRGQDLNKFQAGTIRIGGNFKENVSNENFVGQGSHKVIFTGNGLHEIEIGNSGTCFNILETEEGSKLNWTGYYNVQDLRNDLDIEVPEGKTINFYTDTEKVIDLKGHHVSITGDAVHDSGKLEFNGAELTISGDLRSGGDIDLDQGTLSIGGNLHHTSGSIEIAGGTLEIKGDYQNYQYVYENGRYYDGGYGSLVMEKETDSMTVGKDFYMYSYCDQDENKLEAGTIRIGGNFKQGALDENFIGQGTHKTIFTGNGTHIISMESEDAKFNILEITGAYENYIFNKIPCWNTLMSNNQEIANTVFGDYEVEIIEDEKHNKTAEIVGYVGKDENLVVPDTISGYTVTEIGDSVFAYRDFLKSLELPYTAVKLGWYLVNGCENLEEVVIFDSVTEIAEGNFQYGVPKLVLYVEPGSYAEEYAKENDIPFEYYLRKNVTLEASVKNQDGEVLQSGYDIYWYDAEDFQFLGRGNRLRNLEEGKKYQFDITLGEELSYQYQQPKMQTVTASAGNTVTEIVLTPYEKIEVNGTVKDTDGQTIPSAKIKLKQTYNGMYEKVLETETDEQGRFSVTADQITGTVVVKADGYYDSVYTLPQNLEEQKFTINAEMRKLPSNKISLSFNVKKAGKTGDTEVITPLTDTSGLKFKLYNETKKKEITDFTVQYPTLSIGDDTIEKGDNLRLSVSDEKKQLAEYEETVTLDENKCAELKGTLTENGSIQIGKISGNEENVVFIFNSDKQCTGNQTTGTSYQSSAVPAGNYTLVLMKKTSLLRSVDSLDKLSELGLKKDTDYAQMSVTVEKGVITDIREVIVPVLDESKLYYTVSEETNLWTNMNSAITGQYITIRAKYEIDSKYTTTDENLQIELPEDMTLVEKSLTVDGKSKVCAISGNTVTVNVNQKKGTIRFYVLATKAGNKRIHAYLNFENNNKKVTQPIGSVSVDVTAASITVPEKTGFTEVSVTGKTLPNSEITVYDNDIVVGNTVSRKNGSWGTEISLTNPRNYSVHSIYAVIRNQEYDIELQTDVSKLIYNKNYIEVSKVTMINIDWLNKEWVTVFDFLHPDGEAGSYDYTSSHPGFTFKVEFTGGDAEDLEDVYVVTKNSNGDLTYVSCDYDSQSKCWIGTHDYLEFSDVPSSVDVQFNTNKLIQYEGEEADSQEVIESIMEISERNKNVEDSLEEAVEFGDEAVENEKISFPLKCGNEEIAFYELEVVDYSLFDLDAWKEDNCQIYEYEDGSYSYQTSYTEDTTYITLMAFPDEKMLVKESLTLPDPETAILTIGETIAAGGKKKIHWSDAVKNTYDIVKLHYDVVKWTKVITGLDDVESLWGEGEDIKRKVEILNNDLEIIQKVLERCLCLDNSAYKSDLVKYQVLVSTFKDDAYARYGGTLLANALIFAAGGRIGKLATKGTFTVSKKLYRYVQKKCGHSGRGRLKKWVKNSLDFVSEETGDKIKDKFEDISNVIENIFSAKNYVDAQYQELEDALCKIKEKLTERKCPCKLKTGKCDCNWKNNPDPNITDHPVTPKADPSGYVYEAVPSNRIEGVRSEIYYYDYALDEFGVAEDQKSDILWDAENYDQANPQYTDTAGTFGWNVPEGQWLVKFSKDGYEDTDSHNDVAVDEEGYLPVPPIQTEVNTAMISNEAPAVSSVNAYQDGIDITFSQYMEIDTVNRENIVVMSGGKTVSGTIRPTNAEYDYEGQKQYASSFVLESEETLNGNISISVKNVKNYHGLQLAKGYNETIPVQIRPEKVELETAGEIPYSGNKDMVIRILPAAAGANKTLTVTSYSPSIVGTESTTVTTDSEGTASVKLKGNLPGQGIVSVTLDGTQLLAEQMVRVSNINAQKSLETGEYQIVLEKDTFVYNKKAQTPKVEIEGLTENTDFTVAYSNNINAGTAMIEVTGIGAYTGTLTRTFTITKAANKISASNISKSASTKSKSYSINARADGGKLEYRSDNNKITVNESGKVKVAANYTGKAEIQITASDENYETATCTITVKITQAANTITASNIKKTYSSKEQTVSLKVKRKGTGKITYKSNVKNVKISSSGKVKIPAKFVGKVTVTVKVAAKGIYKAASKKITITVNPAGTTLSSVKNSASKTITAAWKRNKQVSGYEIQYSTNKKLTSGNKTVRVTKNSITSQKLKNLKKGKTYYVRIRTYKTVSGKKYYSDWSAVKSVKVSK